MTLTPPGSVLQKVENRVQRRLRIRGGEPGDVGFTAKPRGLALGETTGRPDRLFHRRLEGELSSQVLHDLPIPDRLEGGSGGVPTGLEQPLHLTHPARSDHCGHAARQSIVQDRSRDGQTDAERR
jgi:hypothetical protein